MYEQVRRAAQKRRILVNQRSIVRDSPLFAID